MSTEPKYFLNKSDASELFERRWTLTVVSGPDRGVHCPVSSQLLLLGAANASALSLVDDTVSRYGKSVQPKGLVARSRFHERNIFDGREITECFVRSGDRFYLGNSEVELTSEDEVVHVSLEQDESSNLKKTQKLGALSWLFTNCGP